VRLKKNHLTGGLFLITLGKEVTVVRLLRGADINAQVGDLPFVDMTAFIRRKGENE